MATEYPKYSPVAALAAVSLACWEALPTDGG
jgi:hypothetical protein